MDTESFIVPKGVKIEGVGEETRSHAYPSLPVRFHVSFRSLKFRILTLSLRFSTSHHQIAYLNLAVHRPMTSP